MHDQRILDAASVNRLFKVFKRRVSRHGPARVVVRVGGSVASVVVLSHVGIEVGLQAV